MHHFHLNLLPRTYFLHFFLFPPFPSSTYLSAPLSPFHLVLPLPRNVNSSGYSHPSSQFPSLTYLLFLSFLHFLTPSSFKVFPRAPSLSSPSPSHHLPCASSISSSFFSIPIIYSSLHSFFFFHLLLPLPSDVYSPALSHPSQFPSLNHLLFLPFLLSLTPPSHCFHRLLLILIHHLCIIFRALPLFRPFLLFPSSTHLFIPYFPSISYSSSSIVYSSAPSHPPTSTQTHFTSFSIYFFSISIACSSPLFPFFLLSLLHFFKISIGILILQPPSHSHHLPCTYSSFYLLLYCLRLLMSFFLLPLHLLLVLLSISTGLRISNL